MRKIAISALGVLVPVLACPTALGQVPRIKIPVKIQSDADALRQVEFQRLLKALEKDAVLNVDARVRVNQLRGALLRQHNVVFRVNGTIIRQGPEAEPLYTLRSGVAELLPNGNILIVETDRGRALEISPRQEIVWEFRNPHRVGEGDGLTANLYSLERVEAERAAWLAR